MRTRAIASSILIGMTIFAGFTLAFARSPFFLEATSATTQSDPAVQNNAEFYAAANTVLQTMSKILDLPVKSPLKESVRTKAQIRQYLVDAQNKEETPEKRYADRRTLEAFGLIPKGFPLDSFLLDLLTDQVAGLYDPHGKQFFIADWISPVEQKPVMAHELTHALDDQYFHLKKWQDAVRSDDDASLARDAVIEGSALAAMMDYTLADLHTNVRSLPDIAPFIESGVAGQMDKDPNLAKAPEFIRDELLFPYLQGAEFTQQVLKESDGWPDFKKVFQNPPASTQQILHPELYFQNVRPEDVKFPGIKSALPAGYVQLDDNVVGEFALGEILKKFNGPGDAEKFAPMWRGDRYILFENKNSKQAILIVLFALDSDTDAAAFFPVYRKVLEKKDALSAPLSEGPQLAIFANAYISCAGEKCLIIDGAGQEASARIAGKLGWQASTQSDEAGNSSALSQTVR